MVFVSLGFAAVTALLTLFVVRPYVKKNLPSVTGKKTSDYLEETADYLEVSASPITTATVTALATAGQDGLTTIEGGKTTTADVEEETTPTGCYGKFTRWWSSKFGEEADAKAKARTAALARNEIENMNEEEEDAMYVKPWPLYINLACLSSAAIPVFWVASTM